jgi:hypothetical protein
MALTIWSLLLTVYDQWDLKTCCYLDSQCNTLQLRLHLVEFLNVATGADKVLRHHLASRHLARLCRLLDVIDELLLLDLELCAFAVQLALCLFERALVLTQPLGGSQSSSKGPAETRRQTMFSSRTRGIKGRVRLPFDQVHGAQLWTTVLCLSSSVMSGTPFNVGVCGSLVSFDWPINTAGIKYLRYLCT